MLEFKSIKNVVIDISSNIPSCIAKVCLVVAIFAVQLPDII